LRRLRRRLAHSASFGRDDGAFPHGDLLVGIERKHRRLAEGADLAPAVLGSDGLACILEQKKIARAAKLAELGHLAGLAEEMDRQHRSRSFCNGRCRERGIQVHGRLVDVGEYRHRALVEHAVGGCDEAERGGDHLVAVGDAGCADTEVKPGGPIDHAYRMLRPDIARECALEAGQKRTEAENLAAQRLGYELDIFRRDVRCGHRYALLIATATNATYSHPICSPSLRKRRGLQHPSAAIAIAPFCGNGPVNSRMAQERYDTPPRASPIAHVRFPERPARMRAMTTLIASLQH
jgi:hypothetical protein